MKIIHITDVHLVTQGQTLCGINPHRRLQLAIDSINDEHPDAGMVVFTGDLTDAGDPSSYALFEQEAKRLTMPYYVMLGNHDNRENFITCFPDYALDDNGFVQYTVQNDAGTFIMCDSVSDGDYGAYCSSRCAWLSAQLQQASGDVYIFMHHPLMDCGFAPIDNIKQRDGEDIYQILKPHKDKIRYMFFGHTHLCTSGTWRDISYSVMRSLVVQVQLVIGARRTNYPSNNLESPAYGVVLLDDDGVTYHTYSFANLNPKLFINWRDVGQLNRQQLEDECKAQLEKYKNWSDY